MTEAIAYMRSEYSVSYQMAINDAKNKTKNLYFDTRYWSSKDISVFFDDLQVCDNHTFCMIVNNLRNRKAKFSAVEKRIKEWKAENLKDLNM
jgi:hypothetical protein